MTFKFTVPRPTRVEFFEIAGLAPGPGLGRRVRPWPSGPAAGRRLRVRSLVLSAGRGGDWPAGGTGYRLQVVQNLGSDSESRSLAGASMSLILMAQIVAVGADDVWSRLGKNQEMSCFIIEYNNFSKDTNTSVTAEKHHSVDWDNEASIYHKSAMNCLHNYALGKMHVIDTKLDPKSHKPAMKKRLIKALQKHLLGRSHSSRLEVECPGRKGHSISFAENLEQIFEIESATADEHSNDICSFACDCHKPPTYDEQGTSIDVCSSCSTDRCQEIPGINSTACVANFTFPEITGTALPDASQFPKIE